LLKQDFVVEVRFAQGSFEVWIDFEFSVDSWLRKNFNPSLVGFPGAGVMFFDCFLPVYS
jgi:hypothetical protein